MAARQNDKRSQLFMLRVWPEELGEGRVEWRGKIRQVLSGETVYFHDWAVLMEFLKDTLELSMPLDGTERS